MIPHRDEILRPAVSTDATAVPRYNLVRPDGTIAEKNVALRLSNPVAREGTPISKAVLDEMLAASGVTAGTATAYTLAQEEYTLFDGAPVRFRLHTASGDGATLNINGTGAKPLRDMMSAAMPGGIPAGTWLTAYYSAAAGAYILAGGEAVRALYGERYTVDDAVAHVKDVPADALPAAEIGEIGGMTYKVNVGTEANPVYELRSTAVTEMESVGVNLIDGANKPLTFQAYPITITAGEYICTVRNPDGTSNGIISGNTYFASFRDDDNNIIVNAVHRGATVTGEQASKISKLYVSFDNSHYTGDFTTVTHQLNRGLVALPYTPFVHNTLPIPEAVRALDGYGWGINKTVRNYVDWKNRKFVKMVAKVIFDGSADENWMMKQFSNLCAYIIPFSNTTLSKAIICDKFDTLIHATAMPDGTIGVAVEGIDANNGGVFFGVKGLASSIDEWRNYLANNPVTVVVAFATPIITDISDILPADNLVRVEAGGTITAVNEYGYAVPTMITYQRDVLANRASIFALEKLRLAMELLASIDYVDDTVSATIAAAVAPLAKANLSNASGTFGGVVKANASAVSALGTAQVRNVTISNVDLTAGSSALATGDSYRVYS